MSILKEPAYIRQVSALMGMLPVEENAARLILTHVEMRLREVVIAASKNSLMLNKSRIGSDDIDIAISEQAYEDFEWNQPLLAYMPQNLGATDHSHHKDDPYFFNNKVISIDDKIQELMKQTTKPEEKIFVDWVQLENQIPKSASNTNVMLAKRRPETFLDGNPSNLKYKKKLVQGILIKEPERTQQTKEFEEFLESYASLMSEQAELIDSGKYKFGFPKFKYCSSL